MNPPQSFIDYAASVNPQVNQVNTPIIIGQGLQAVMIPAGSGMVDDSGNAGSADPSTVVEGTSLPVVGSDSAVSTLAATATAGTSSSLVEPSSDTATSAVTILVQTSATSTPSAPTTATVTLSASTTTPDSTIALASTPTSANTISALSTAASNTPSTASTTPATSSITSASVNSPSSTSPISSIASSTATSAAATSSSHPFIHSAAFIFLLVLSSLVLVAIIATLVSTLLRRSFFPCCHPRPDLDDEGLSEIVQSFHTSTPSRSSTLRRNGSIGELQRRSSLFANGGRGNSPFLHSGEMGYGNMSMDGTAQMLGIPGRVGGGSGGAPSLAVPTPAHSFGVPGPLEVRNAFPGELGQEGDMYEKVGVQHEVLSTSSPRFLGLDGHGLDVPWSRSQSGETIGLGITAHESKLSSPYLSPPDARDYLGPAFPSPAATVDDLPQSNHRTSLDYPSPDQPQRAGTWASNLRSTLFAAIASTGVAVGGQAKPDSSQDDDRFTRQILPLHRNSTRRASEFANTNTFGRSSQAFPIVEEEKDAYGYPDHYCMPASDVEVIGGVFLAPSISMSSTDSRYPVMPMRAKKLPPRGSAGQRYQAAYARSRGGASEEESGVESEAGWSVDETVPSRLAGGERAKGVRG